MTRREFESICLDFKNKYNCDCRTLFTHPEYGYLRFDEINGSMVAIWMTAVNVDESGNAYIEGWRD